MVEPGHIHAVRGAQSRLSRDRFPVADEVERLNIAAAFVAGQEGLPITAIRELRHAVEAEDTGCKADAIHRRLVIA